MQIRDIHSYTDFVWCIGVQNSHNYEISKPLKYPIIQDYFLCNLQKVTKKKYTNLEMDL